MNIFLLLVSLAAATEVEYTKQVNPDRLYKELKVAGCAMQNITENGRRKWVTFSGPCDVKAVVKAHVYVDAKAQRKATEDALDVELAKNLPNPVVVARLQRQLQR